MIGAYYQKRIYQWELLSFVSSKVSFKENVLNIDLYKNQINTTVGNIPRPIFKQMYKFVFSRI